MHDAERADPARTERWAMDHYRETIEAWKGAANPAKTLAANTGCFDDKSRCSPKARAAGEQMLMTGCPRGVMVGVPVAGYVHLRPVRLYR
jgi:hypothetical protein